MSKDKFLNGVSRRTFFSAAAGVFGAASVARPSRRVDAKFPTSDGFVVSSELQRCVKCGRLGGHVLERYNGTVPVLGDVPAAVEFGRVAAAPVNTLRQQTHRCQEISVCF